MTDITTKNQEEQKDILPQLPQIIPVFSRKSASEPEESNLQVSVPVPVLAQAPPIQIFHPIFGAFIHILHDPAVQPSGEDLLNVRQLMHYLSAFKFGDRSREDTRTRNADIRARLGGILGYAISEIEERNNDETGATSDAVCVAEVGDCRVPVLIADFERVLGEGGSDPSIQVGRIYTRAWTGPDQRDLRDIICCPTLMIAGAGPWLTVLGAVRTDRVIAQRLTDTAWVGLGSTEEDGRVYNATRVFVALRTSLGQLEGFYSDVHGAGISPFRSDPTGPHMHPRFFPYPTTFVEDNHAFHFRYIRMLQDDASCNCVTYLAEILSEDSESQEIAVGEKVVVKFAARYGEEVHRFLAEHGYAPRLRYYGPLSTSMPNPPQFDTEPSLIVGPAAAANAPPGLAMGFNLDLMRMVVMDYIRTLPEPPADARQQVHDVLVKLHCEGYVFGDLWEPNILFDADADDHAGGAVKSIDFNWSGSFDVSIRDEGLPDGLQDRIDRNFSVVPERRLAVGVERGRSDAHFPLALSVTNRWPDGMAALKPMRPIHDWRLFEKLDFRRPR